MKKIQEMTDREIDKEIGVYLGWVEVPTPFERHGIEILKGWGETCWYHPDKPGVEFSVPRYSSSLDVMYEAEEKLTPEQQEMYAVNLTEGLLNPLVDLDLFWFVHKSAKYRAIAFLETICV